MTSGKEYRKSMPSFDEIWNKTAGGLHIESIKCPTNCGRTIYKDRHGNVDGGWERSHLWPESDDGNFEVESNLRAICHECNRGCSSMHKLDYCQKMDNKYVGWLIYKHTTTQRLP